MDEPGTEDLEIRGLPIKEYKMYMKLLSNGLL